MRMDDEPEVGAKWEDGSGGGAVLFLLCGVCQAFTLEGHAGGAGVNND